ncbi:MAG: galactitol-1-phosphate 5-dehydrogenase [Lachnospiraceae bacterium]|nr:galactitol-1-phosphate 5-dehydrogenase [Lachnospiraceae bacterium]
MKAWVLHDIGDIRFENVPDPEPKEGEVLLAVKAAGVCGSDVPRVYKTGAHKMPLIPGHEFAGEVLAVGKAADKALIGKRVGVFPLIPCRKCGPCRDGQYEMCRDYNYLGSRCDGAFAEYVCAPAGNLIELPEGVTFKRAAMLEPMAVAVHALRQGIYGHVGVRNIAVWGLGTIGSMLAAFLYSNARWEKLIVIGNKESQRERLKELGLSGVGYIDSRECDPAEVIKEECGGADLIFECVGRNEVLSGCVDAAAPGGYVVTVGNPASDMTLDRDTYWKILRNQLTVKGTWNSSFTGDENDDWHFVIRALENRDINAKAFISHRFGLEELDRGLMLMRDKTEDYCKVMVTP